MIKILQMMMALYFGFLMSVAAKHPGIGRGIPRPCICPANYQPVCGVNVVTYSNLCRLNCAQVRLAYRGRCRRPACVCPKIYRPVCGVNGKTYANACLAKCAGVGVKHTGPCKN